jgi:hypothetical protein
MKCVFKPVNGDKTGAYARTGMSRTYPSPGILFMYKCPDGQSFLVNPDDGNGWYYKLIDPPSYGLPNQDMYAYVDDEFISSRTIIEDTPPAPPITSTTTPYTAPQLTNVNGLGNLGKVNSSNSDARRGSGITTIFSVKDISKITNYKRANERYYVPKEGAHLPAINKNGELVPKSYFDYTYDQSNGHTYETILSALHTVNKNVNLISSATSGYRSYTRADLKNEMLNHFNRYKLVNPEMVLTKTFPYVFFTRPNLNIILKTTFSNNTYKLHPQVENDPNCYYLYKNAPCILASLTQPYASSHYFLPILSSRAQSFELSDEYIKSVEVGETFTGHKIKYARHNIESKTAGTFTISYTEDDEFLIYKLHKLWIDYMSKVYRGEYSPDKNTYRENKELDYASSLYYFLLGPDGETILFWSKYYGVYPSNVPTSASSWTKGSSPSMLDYNITYEYGWKNDFDPLTLVEFNKVSKVDSGTGLDYYTTYEPLTLSIGRTFAGAPFIETVTNSVDNSYEFKLRFRTRSDLK